MHPVSSSQDGEHRTSRNSIDVGVHEMAFLDFGLAPRQSIYLDFDARDNSEKDIIVDNFTAYDLGFAIPTRESPWHEYFDRISQQEISALVELFSPPSIDSKILIYEGISALAVGSTPYPLEYWKRLEGVCERMNDAIALEYAKRKGEDIDVLICSSDNRSSRLNATIIKNGFASLAHNLKDIGWTQDSIDCEPMWVAILALAAHSLRWPIEIVKDKHENGTTFMTVPDEFRAQEGNRGVIRLKEFIYWGTSVLLSPPDARRIHVRARLDVPLREILRDERCLGQSFTLLLEGGKYWEFGTRAKMHKELFRGN